MKRYLVTGGAGFIGSHIVERLVQEKQSVRILDNFSSGKEANLKPVINKVEIIRGDIRSQDTCLKATQGIDFVLHQAALRSVPKSMLHPADYNEVNIQGTLNLLMASKENKVRGLVFASSSSVYGEVKEFPQKENFIPQPISPYALTKLCGEYYCRMFSHHYKLPTTALRYFNVFGPRQALDDEYAVVIPKFIVSMLKGEHPPIYGTGKQSRDFTFVANVVNANLLAAKRKNAGGEVFNIASGKDYTVLQLTEILNKLMRKNIKPVFLPVRTGDVFRTWADVSRAKNKLGLNRKIDFIEGLKLTVEYFSSESIA